MESIRVGQKVLGIQLIEQTGSRKGGHTLTPGGRPLMEKFGEWFDAVEASAVDKARELFPWSCTCFKDAHAERQGEKD